MDSDTTTLYLRGMQRRIVREAKAAAARNGETLAAVVSHALERELHGDRENAELATSVLGDSIKWFDANRSRLLARYDGEYVAIMSDAVADHDKDFEKLAERVFARFGVGAVFMPRVQRSDQVVRVRSPRQARS